MTGDRISTSRATTESDRIPKRGSANQAPFCTGSEAQVVDRTHLPPQKPDFDHPMQIVFYFGTGISHVFF